MRLVALYEIFDAVYGVNLEVNKMVIDSEGIPFVSRQEKNNGICAMVKPVNNVKPNPEKTLSVAVSGSVLETFYQDVPYYSGRDLYYLKPMLPLSKLEMLYYCMAIRANKYRYNYGRQANKTIRGLKIPHPEDIPVWVKNTNFPDIPSRLPHRSKYFDLKSREWKDFRYTEIFKITRGKGIAEQDRIAGKVPYLSSSKFNNGCTDFISNPLFMEENAIVYNILGDAFYFSDSFTASGDISIFKNKNLNAFNGLFLATIISKNKYKYSFGRKATKNKFINDIISLPATPEGTPDWQFMEDYIKSLPYSSNLK